MDCSGEGFGGAAEDAPRYAEADGGPGSLFLPALCGQQQAGNQNL